MTDDELADTTLPFWVANGEPEPPTVYAWLDLDRAYEDDRVGPVWLRWRHLVEQRLVPLFGPRPPAPYLDEDPTPAEPWARVERNDPGGAGVVATLGLQTDEFADGGHAFLEVSAGLGADRGGIDEVVEVVFGVLRDVAAASNPAYGELTVGRTGRAPRTALDLALGREAADSAAGARAALRGYEWATVVPAELAVGFDTGAFADVTALDGGARLLRATPTVGGWSPEAARAVFVALAPVLPAGRARRTSEAELTRVVFADAGDVRAGRVADLPVGPAPLPAPGPEQVAVLTELISEVMARGWLTMEPMDDSAPAPLRAFFPPGMGLTPDGQRFVAERLGLT
jgi:hypothetical protein